MSSLPPEKLKSVIFTVETSKLSNENSKLFEGNGKIYLASISAYLYMLAIGMTVSYTSPATVDMKKPGSRLQHITADDITWMGSLILLGSLFAIPLGGYFTHRYGRKIVLMLTSILLTLSWLMIAYSPSVAWICAGRLFSGFFTGLYIVAIPSYVAEIAPQNIRGKLSSGFPLAKNFGILIVMILGSILRWSWLAICIVVVIAFASCMMVFMPESPVWLVRESRLYEATCALKFFYGKSFNYTGEIDKMVISSEKQNKPITLEDLRNPIFYKPLLISVAMMVFHTTAGLTPVLTYTHEIFERAGSSIAPDIAAIVFAVVQIIATAVCGVVIDNFGRRKLYMLSGVGTSFLLFCMGIYSYMLVYHPVKNSVMGYIPLLCLSLFTFIYSIGMGSIPFVLIPEMVSVQYRSMVLSFSLVCASLFSFAITKSYNNLVNSLGDYGLYSLFGFCTLLSVLFGYFVLPETKKLSFEEISKRFTKSQK